jgi:hypothetical protein
MPTVGISFAAAASGFVVASISPLAIRGCHWT